MWIIILLGICALGFSAYISKLCLNPASRLWILDHPNHRSLHTKAIPKSGGVAIVLSILVCWASYWIYNDFSVSGQILAISVTVLMLMLLGVLDTLYNLSALFRIFFHFLAASVIVYVGYYFESFEIFSLVFAMPFWFSAIISVFFIVWLMNIYNFMDGMDGYAAGMSVFGFSTLSIIAYLDGQINYAFYSMIVALSSLGFLIFNFPPARLFMGDSGSVTLGFLAAVFCLWGSKLGCVNFWVLMIIFSPFVADSSVTLLIRVWRKEKIWEAHNTHLYQQMVLKGIGYKKTLLIQTILMLFSSSTAIIMYIYEYKFLSVAVVACLIFYFIFFLTVKYKLIK